MWTIFLACVFHVNVYCSIYDSFLARSPVAFVFGIDRSSGALLLHSATNSQQLDKPQWSRWSRQEKASKWAVSPSKHEVRCEVGGPTLDSIWLVECGRNTYPYGLRGAARWRFGAKLWWAESRVARSTRRQEYLFSSASPGLVLRLCITCGETKK